MKSMTFGVMPSKSAFHAAYAKEMHGYPAGYHYELRGEDAASARKARVPIEGHFSEKQLYGIIKKLRDAYNKGDDNAGSLASSLLSTLDFEWI